MAKFQKMYRQGKSGSFTCFRLAEHLSAGGSKLQDKNPERLWRYGAVMRPGMIFDIGGRNIILRKWEILHSGDGIKTSALASTSSFCTDRRG